MAAVSMISMVTSLLVMLSSSSISAKTVASPAPAPAPGPDYVDLAYLLSVAGPFHTFLNLLESTEVMKTFQDQANNTKQGITIFVPKDRAFTSLKKPSLSNLTDDQKKSLLLFHALPKFYTLSDFTSLSQSGPVTTMAGGQYSLNFTDDSGTVHLGSGWTSTKVSSSVHSTSPVSLFQVDKVLLPEAIFGKAPPAPLAPAPSPDIAPAADSTPSTDENSHTTPKSSSHKIISMGALLWLVVAIASGLILIF